MNLKYVCIAVSNRKMGSLQCSEFVVAAEFSMFICLPYGTDKEDSKTTLPYKLIIHRWHNNVWGAHCTNCKLKKNYTRFF